MSTPELVIYHGGCRDGFCAAWVAHKVMPDAEFVPGYYGQPPPAVVADRQVYILDFSYPRPMMEQIATVAESFVILDHHKTAEEALRGFHPNLGTVVFDMERSGAALAWDWFIDRTIVQNCPRPWLVEYVQDRDLWRKALPLTEEINAYISTLPFDFDAWTAAEERPAAAFVGAGKAVLAKVEQYVREVRKNAQRFQFEGYDVPLVNAPQVDISELLDSLTPGEPFAMGWWQRSDGVFQYSLRSRGDVDVSELATRHGGGGHKNAAGFQVARLLHSKSAKP